MMILLLINGLENKGKIIDLCNKGKSDLHLVLGHPFGPTDF